MVHCILLRFQIQQEEHVRALHTVRFLKIASFDGIRNFLPVLPPDSTMYRVCDPRFGAQTAGHQFQKEEQVILIVEVQDRFFFCVFQNAAQLCRLAYSRRQEAQEGAALVPTYLRPSQAERELKKKGKRV